MSLGSKERALELLSVSRETLAKIEVFEALLRKWNRSINLVGPDALEDLWIRHIADSAQLVRHAPDSAKVWVDLGSGAGFPGVILGLLLAERPDARVHLIESDQKKCAFLRTVSRETAAPLKIHCGRAETELKKIEPVEIVVSRAVASLPRLLEWSRPSLEAGARGLFLKGKHYRRELTGYQPPSTLSLSFAPSLTDPEAVIVIARAAAARPTALLEIR